MSAGLVEGADGLSRCWWAGSTPDYLAYHDDEWGLPTRDDRRLFEKLCLEGFQSGLSWLTILRKREAFRRAFKGFDFDVVARFNTRSVDRLLGDATIVRHRGKIEASINNAKCARAIVQSHGSFASYLWQFEPDATTRPKRVTKAALAKVTQSDASVALSRDLKRRGFRYVGPTTMYALMQAMGLVNDHLEGCSARARCAAARAAFDTPSIHSDSIPSDSIRPDNVRMAT